MKRVAIVFAVLAVLLFTDGLYMVLANYHPGDANTFFGNQTWNISDGEVTLISSAFLAVAAVVMFVIAFRRQARSRADQPVVRPRRRSNGAPNGVPGVSLEARDGQLRAEDVSFAYLGAARAALRHVNLGVAPGEVVLITGASGCGKSTLALALCGLIPVAGARRAAGRATFGAAPLSGMKPHQASQLGRHGVPESRTSS